STIEPSRLPHSLSSFLTHQTPSLTVFAAFIVDPHSYAMLCHHRSPDACRLDPPTPVTGTVSLVSIMVIPKPQSNPTFNHYSRPSLATAISTASPSPSIVPPRTIPQQPHRATPRRVTSTESHTTATTADQSCRREPPISDFILTTCVANRKLHGQPRATTSERQQILTMPSQLLRALLLDYRIEPLPSSGHTYLTRGLLHRQLLHHREHSCPPCYRSADHASS
ncbi:unnamed protein product, partial [Sphenostylis stenocarpa]